MNDNIITLKDGTRVKRRLGTRQQAVLVKYINGYGFDKNVSKYPKGTLMQTVSFWIDEKIED